MMHSSGCQSGSCGQPPPDFQESLYHNYCIGDEDYIPSRWDHEVYMPLPDDVRLRLYDDGFWLCKETGNYFEDRRAKPPRKSLVERILQSLRRRLMRP